MRKREERAAGPAASRGRRGFDRRRGGGSRAPRAVPAGPQRPAATPPEGIASPIDAVPIELQHRLWLQSCFDPLIGIGQPTYEKNPDIIRLKDQPFRVAEFIEQLREHRDTVEYLKLTLENMLKILLLPKNDEKLFVMLMSESLGLESRQTLLSGFL